MNGIDWKEMGIDTENLIRKQFYWASNEKAWVRRGSVGWIGTLRDDNMWGREMKERKILYSLNFMPEIKAAAQIEEKRGEE